MEGREAREVEGEGKSGKEERDEGNLCMEH